MRLRLLPTFPFLWRCFRDCVSDYFTHECCESGAETILCHHPLNKKFGEFLITQIKGGGTQRHTAKRPLLKFSISGPPWLLCLESCENTKYKNITNTIFRWFFESVYSPKQQEDRHVHRLRCLFFRHSARSLSSSVVFSSSAPFPSSCFSSCVSLARTVQYVIGNRPHCPVV